MCGCQKRERWIVVLSTGMKFAKGSEAEAKAFADQHPGATYSKA